MIVDHLHAREAIASALYSGVRELGFSDPDEAARSFGIRPLGKMWRRVDRETAELVLLALLKEDMAYSSPRISESEAKSVTAEFFAHFSADATFLTNGNWEEGWTKSADIAAAFGPQWEPATNATFDGGMLAFDLKRSGILWLEDED